MIIVKLKSNKVEELEFFNSMYESGILSSLSDAQIASLMCNKYCEGGYRLVNDEELFELLFREEQCA